MARLPRAPVDLDLLDSIFEEFEILSKVQDGRLSTVVAYETGAGDPILPDCVSRILKHFTPNGKHVATTHQVEGGHSPHWHGTDFVLGEVRLIRPNE